MVGYVKDKELGALTYNLMHNLFLAISLFLIGIVVNFDLLTFFGLILGAHVGMDRALGFGLKEKQDLKIPT